MANTFNPKTQQLFIDTAASSGSSDAVTEGAGYNGPCKVKVFRWTGATTAGHTCVITNYSDAGIIWQSKADGDNFTDEKLVEDWLTDGFRVITIASGSLDVDLA